MRAVRLVSFNLLHGRSLRDGTVDANRLADTVRSLDPDVIALQEVDRQQPRSHALDLTALVAGAVGARDARFQPTLLGTPGGQWEAAPTPPPGLLPRLDRPGESAAGAAYGVGLVSRYPVRGWHVLGLPKAPVRSPVFVPGMGRRMMMLADEPRIGLAAELLTPAGTLTVTSTHLSFVPGWNLLQLRLLTRRLSRLGGAHVLLGDLNLPVPLPRLVSGWRSLANVPTYPAPSPRLQLDHALAFGAVAPVRRAFAVETEISDHQALVVDIDLPAPEPAR